jgi:hypothetical protein
MVLPQNEVPQSWVFGSVPPQNEVIGPVLQNGVFKFVLPQNGVFEIILSQNEMFNNVTVNCQLSNRVKNTVNFLLNNADKTMEFFILTVIHGAEKLAWEIQILLECLQHILKTQMITDSYSPSGLIWDGNDYSCAYDALLTILYEIWSTHKGLDKTIQENQPAPSQVTVCMFQKIYGWSGQL